VYLSHSREVAVAHAAKAHNCLHGSACVQDIRDNSISGDLHSIFSTFLKEAVYVDFAGNSFSGTIPTEVGLLEKVETLYLQNNPLSGAIPSEL
jgi:hypothetical protein